MNGSFPIWEEREAAQDPKISTLLWCILAKPGAFGHLLEPPMGQAATVVLMTAMAHCEFS